MHHGGAREGAPGEHRVDMERVGIAAQPRKPTLVLQAEPSNSQGLDGHFAFTSMSAIKSRKFSPAAKEPFHDRRIPSGSLKLKYRICIDQRGDVETLCPDWCSTR